MIFEKNMFAGYSKNELETVINAIKKRLGKTLSKHGTNEFIKVKV